MSKNKEIKYSPKITVVMSAYNAEKYVGEAIESILSQTMSDFEFIIIEDKSTDRTKKIIQEYALKDKRIIPIYNKKNRGHIGFIKNLNLGLKKARGNYIARMDADDIAMPTRFEEEYNFLEKNKEIFLVGCGAFIINKNGENISEFNPICDIKKLSHVIPKGGQIYHPTIMFRNIKKIFYREKALYCEDFDLYLRLLTMKMILGNIPEKLLKYRVINTSISHVNNNKQHLFSEKILEFYYERLKNGKDTYSNFRPDQLLKIKTVTDKELLIQDIKSTFSLDDFTKTKKLGKEFFKKYGFDRILIYSIISNLGGKTIKKIRKINVLFKKIKQKTSV